MCIYRKPRVSLVMTIAVLVCVYSHALAASSHAMTSHLAVGTGRTRQACWASERSWSLESTLGAGRDPWENRFWGRI